MSSAPSSSTGPTATGSPLWVWASRLIWLATSALLTLSVGDALDGRSSAAGVVVNIAATAVWAVVLVAVALPSTVGLTVARTVAPLGVVTAVGAWAGGAEPALAIAATAVALVAVVVIGGAEVGQAFVQASSYGDEFRHLLRPPAAVLPAMVVGWLLWAGALTASVLLLAAGRWPLGIVLALITGATSWLLVPRLHRLSRRWLVVVPAGLVVHDQLVLAETLMVRRGDVTAVGLALAGTEAADFTGPAAGHAVEVALGSMVTVVLARRPSTPKGTALHVRSFLVAPTRPGQALRSAAAGSLPVG